MSPLCPIFFQCDDLPVSEKVALQLAGLQAQVNLGDPQSTRLELYDDVDSFLPLRIKQARFLSDSEWMPILAEAHQHYGAAKTEVVAKVWYLSCVMQYPLYGCTMFKANYKSYWQHGSVILLGVNARGILLIRPDDKTVLAKFSYNEIESLLLDPGENFLTLTIAKMDGDDSQAVHVLETQFKFEVGALVASYFPSLAGCIKEADPPHKRKPKHITNEDRQKLHGALVSARRALVDNTKLRKPTGDELGGNFFKNTLRRLSVKRSERFRCEVLANEQGEVYKGYSHSFWAFSRTPLSTTLSGPTVGLSETDETQAVEVFRLILTYAGLLSHNPGKHTSYT